MEICFHRHRAYLLHLSAAQQHDRRLLIMTEVGFDGHVVLSLGDWRYNAQDPELAAAWQYQHLPSAGLNASMRRRIEAAIPSVPQVSGLAHLSPVPTFDRADGEWMSQFLWGQFRRPSIVWLNVPYHSREKAKRLGARWNAQARRWFGVKSADCDANLSTWQGPAKRH